MPQYKSKTNTQQKFMQSQEKKKLCIWNPKRYECVQYT